MGNEGLGCFLFGVLIGIILCLTISSVFLVYKSDVVKHGAAQYNPQTGEFEWLQSESFERTDKKGN